MQNPRPVSPSLSWLHRKAATGDDGVYWEAVSRFGYFSLLLCEPCCRACLRILFYALLLALFLWGYAGSPASAWFPSSRTTALLRQFLSPISDRLDTLFPQLVHLLPDAPHARAARGVAHLRSESNFLEGSHRSLRSLIREALGAGMPAPAVGSRFSLLELLECITSAVVLLFMYRSLRRVASGFQRSSLDAYSRRLIAATKSSRLDSSSSSPSSAASSPHQQPPAWGNNGQQLSKGVLEADTKRLLQGQVAVVTGASSGVGKETAVQLAKWGARVYCGTHTAPKGPVAAFLNAQVAAEEEASADAELNTPRNKSVLQALRCFLSSPRRRLVEAFCCNSSTVHMGTSFKDRKEAESPLCFSRAGSYEPRLHVHELDLCNAASVCGFARWVLTETGGQVDILINNAAQMWVPTLTPVNFGEKACFEYQFVCNHMGHHLLTQLLLPSLKRAATASAAAARAEGECTSLAAAVGAGGGRIINVASCAHASHSSGFSVLDVACTPETAAAAAAAIGADEAARQGEVKQQQRQESPEEDYIAQSLLRTRRRPTAQGYDPWRSYADSKLCNIWFTKELQRQLLASEATASSRASTGATRNALRAPASILDGEGEKSRGEQNTGNGCVGVYAAHPGVVATSLWRHIKEKVPLLQLPVMLGRRLVMKTPADGAATTLFLCIAPKHKLQWGGFYADGSPSWVVPGAHDRRAQRHLWVVSEDVCRPSIEADARVAAFNDT